MRRALRGAALLLLLALFVLPGFAADEKDAKAEPKKEEKKDNGMIRVGQMTAQIVTVNESKKSIRLRYEVAKLNQDAVRALGQAQLELQQAAYKPPQERLQAIANAQRRIAEQQARLYTKANEEVELNTTEDCVVRTKDPQAKFNDKGKLVKPDAKELAELKGDPKMPGYKGEFTDLRSNQIVQVTLMRNRTVIKPKINPKTKEIDPDTIVDQKPQISLILVLGEPRQPAQ